MEPVAPVAWEGQPTATVAGYTKTCLASFQRCLKNSAALYARELSIIEDQLAGFSVWAVNIKVFGAGCESLDYSLREAPDIQDIVVGLLEALDYHLQEC